MFKVLLTGHEGFIGKHLKAALEHEGHLVFGADIEGHPWVDLLGQNEIKSQLDKTNPDLVIHLAAQVGRIFGERDLRHTIEANTTMTTLLAYECGQRDIPILYTSTSEVYGDQGTATCYEDGRLFPSHNLYGLSKGWGEDALRLYAPNGLRIARLSMPYGCGAPPGVGRRAMDTFLWQAHHRMPITVHRGAERSWCHISDTVKALLLIAKQSEGVFNVGRDDRPISMLSLAEQCCDLTGAPKSIIEEVDPPKAQTVVKRLATQKIRDLGWRPTVELDEGLPELLKWVSRFDAEGNFTG